MIRLSNPTDRSNSRMCTKYVCRDCDFIFYIGSKNLKKKPFCPNCGDNVSVEKCEIHRKYWTTKEQVLVNEIISGKLTKKEVSKLTGRTYKAVQRRYEIQMKELELLK